MKKLALLALLIAPLALSACAATTPDKEGGCCGCKDGECSMEHAK